MMLTLIMITFSAVHHHLVEKNIDVLIVYLTQKCQIVFNVCDFAFTICGIRLVSRDIL